MRVLPGTRDWYSIGGSMLLSSVLAGSIALAAQAAVLTVPAPYATIQAAVNAAAPSGDMVLVSAGTYNETVAIEGKSLSIVSVSGAGSTTVDRLVWSNPLSQPNCSGSVVGFTITAGLLAGGLIDDFTLDNCVVQAPTSITEVFVSDPDDPFIAVVVHACQFSANVTVNNTSGSTPSVGVDHCTFSGASLTVNSGDSADVTWCDFTGGGIALTGEDVLIADNTINTSGNGVVVSVDTLGGDVARNRIQGATVGIVVQANSADVNVTSNELTSCGVGIRVDSNFGARRIRENVVCQCGDGIVADDLGDGGDVVSNTVAGCTGDGMRIQFFFSQPVERNNVVDNAVGIRVAGDAEASQFACNNVWNNAGGNWLGIVDPVGTGDNISQDPLFCSIDTCDLHLAAGSPCEPSNSPCAQLIGALGVNCGPPVAVETTTWGSIKARW